MKRNTMFLASALVIMSLAAAAYAQTVVPSNAAKSQRMQLDINHDGAIDRGEAAKSPRLTQAFDRLDKNSDGHLDQSERTNRKHKRRNGGRHGGMARLDADGDGRISRAEADANTRGKRKLGEHFAAIDSNRDGYVVRTELRAYQERMRPQRQAERAKRFDATFTAADLNGDGRLSRVEVDEKMSRMAGSFNWMDNNRDGFLSRDELRSKRSRR